MSFFQLLKRERVRRQVYATRNDARADVFNYIEMFYNPKRRHGDPLGFFEPPEALVPAGLGATRQAPSP